jgi:hypothetical protein
VLANEVQFMSARQTGDDAQPVAASVVDERPSRRMPEATAVGTGRRGEAAVADDDDSDLPF